MGLRWQVAVGPLLRKMGFRVVRAQHQREWTTSHFTRPLLHANPELDEYLWRYADYFAMTEDTTYIVDVKAQPCVHIKLGGKWRRIKSSTVSFTKRETEAYRDAAIPVLILLIQYRDGGPSKVDPVHYGLIPFKDFQFKPNWGGGILPKPPEELLKRLRNGEASKLLRNV